MKTKLNLRRGTFSWTRPTDYALANGIRPESWLSNPSQFAFSFGAYGWTKVRVWAERDCFDAAFEIAVEWLDDNAPGLLVSHSEFAELLKEAAGELGFDYDQAAVDHESEQFQAMLEHAEQDLTIIGHTSLKNGSYIASHEWTVDEITR